MKKKVWLLMLALMTMLFVASATADVAFNSSKYEKHQITQASRSKELVIKWPKITGSNGVYSFKVIGLNERIDFDDNNQSNRGIPELNGYISTVKDAHDSMLQTKRRELLEIVTQCLAAIHSVTDYIGQDVKTVIAKADTYYQQRKDLISETQSLALLDGYVTSMWTYKDQTVTQIQDIIKPKSPVDPKPPVTDDPPVKKHYRSVFRQNFGTKHIETEAELDAYLQMLRTQLLQNMKGFDGIDIK